MKVAKQLRRIIICMLLLLCVVVPSVGYAHSTLIDASPTPSSTLMESPSQIRLTFNEGLEKELFEIQLIDKLGRMVTENKAGLSKDGKQLSLDIPTLTDGVYTISYKAISADGHPIKGSYVFVKGQTDTVSSEEEGSSLQAGGGSSSQLSLPQAFMFGSRILFYVSFLALTGWMFWRLLIRKESAALKRYDRRVGIILQLVFAISLLIMILSQLQELLISWDIRSFLDLLWGTRIGYSWVGTFVLSMLGFIVLHRNKKLTALWVVLMLAAKVLNGHAMSFEPRMQMIVLDFIHLLAASVWVGGLFYLLVHWRKFRETAVQFLPQFSTMALFSMILLTLSGIFYTVGILPKLEYVFYTQWGILLLVKVFLVLIVCGIGLLLRSLMKKNHVASLSTLIKVDFGVMLSILLIVGVFTYMNPLPSNSPLTWQETSSKGDISIVVTSGASGTYTFSVTAHGPVADPTPKNVRVYIESKDSANVAPIEVPLTTSSNEPSLYSAQGPYPPFPGKWSLKIRVLDTNDDETVYTHSWVVF